MTVAKLDILVWGATSSVGRLVADYLSRHAPAGLKWGIGGRNRAKLEALGFSVPILIANADDPASLDAMLRQVRVVATTVGPYALHGKELVAACARGGVDYCDITGEVLFIREMIEKHHAKAKETGARIVPCCGFDSIPSDLGVWMMQKQAHCSEIKYFLTGAKGGLGGGTAASALHQFDLARDKKIRRILVDPYALSPEFPEKGPGPRDSLDARYDADFKRWTGPFVMASVNTRVVRRTNALAGYPYGKDFRYSESVAFSDGAKGRARALGLSLGLKAAFVALAFKPSRKLAEKFLPKTGEGPSAEVRERGFFNVELLGKKIGGGELRGKVAGVSDPGHGETSKMLAESAICLATTKGEGGVLTPAFALGDALIPRLRAAGMTFEVAAH
jgi:short subunit dehydrogenase-like uncharacterized protein